MISVAIAGKKAMRRARLLVSGRNPVLSTNSRVPTVEYSIIMTACVVTKTNLAVDPALPADATDNDECEGTVFDALCTISTFGQQRGHRTIHLDHHVYDNLCERWIPQKSKSQPFVKVNASIHAQDYQDFGFTMMKNNLTTTTHAMADTG